MTDNPKLYKDMTEAEQRAFEQEHLRPKPDAQIPENTKPVTEMTREEYAEFERTLGIIPTVAESHRRYHETKRF